MRQNKRVDCKAVQGDGSYMVIKPLTFGERAGGVNTNALMERVLEWNWTDWDGEALPLPHDDDSRQLLTDTELEFILAQFGVVLRGLESDTKN